MTRLMSQFILFVSVYRSSRNIDMILTKRFYLPKGKVYYSTQLIWQLSVNVSEAYFV